MKVNSLNFILASVDTMPLFSKNNSLNSHSIKSYININKENNNNNNSIIYTDDSKTENFIVNKNENYSTEINIIISEIENYNNYNNFIYSEYPYFKEENKTNYIPELSKKSEILNKNQISDLHNNLPNYEQYKKMNLLYSLIHDGSSIKTFLNKTNGYKSLILFIKDNNNCIFGAYSNEGFKYNPKKLYGTGETFIFSFFNTNKIHIYLSTEENERYIYSDYNRISFGCSDENFSLSLEDDFQRGYSKKTKTFHNPSLTLSSDNNFTILNIECYTFQNI